MIFCFHCNKAITDDDIKYNKTTKHAGVLWHKDCYDNYIAFKNRLLGSLGEDFRPDGKRLALNDTTSIEINRSGVNIIRHEKKEKEV